MKLKPSNIYLQLSAYTFLYWIFVSNGLDLVQSQASQMVPYIAWIQNPDLYPNDIMAMTFPTTGQMSLYYWVASSLSSLFSPMNVCYILMLVHCSTEVFGLYFLSTRLFQNKSKLFYLVIILLFTLSGVLRHSLGSVAPFGWTVFPDTMATSILLFSLGYFFEKRLMPAFLIAAFGITIHIGVGGFVFFVLGIMYLLYYRDYSFKKIVIAGILFSIIVSPLLITFFTSDLVPMTTSFDVWLESMTIHQGMHTFLAKFGVIQYLPFFFWMILFLISLKFLKSNENAHAIKRFSVISLCLILIATVFVELLHNPTAITLSFIRYTRFITILGVICSVAFVFEMHKYNKLYKKAIPIIGIMFILFLTSLNVLLYHQTYRYYPDFVSKFFERNDTKDNPIQNSLFFQTLKEDRDYVISWKETQEWCRDNTPEQSMILSPYYLRGFRTFSQRSIVFQFRDPPLAKYQQWYFILDVCEKRMIDIGATFTGYSDPTEFQLMLKTLYRNYSVEDINEIAAKYQIEYMVTEKDHFLPFRRLFKNRFFNIYSLHN